MMKCCPACGGFQIEQRQDNICCVLCGKKEPHVHAMRCRSCQHLWSEEIVVLKKMSATINLTS